MRCNEKFDCSCPRDLGTRAYVTMAGDAAKKTFAQNQRWLNKYLLVLLGINVRLVSPP